MEVANEPNFMNICEGIVLEFEVCRFDDAMWTYPTLVSNTSVGKMLFVMIISIIFTSIVSGIVQFHRCYCEADAVLW
jgi:hypothetical protein